HNCDRRPRGWFSSQISEFLRRRRIPAFGTVPAQKFTSGKCFYVCLRLSYPRCFARKRGQIQRQFQLRIDVHFSVIIRLCCVLRLSSNRLKSIVEMFFDLAYSAAPRSFPTMPRAFMVGFPTIPRSVSFLFHFHTYPLPTRERFSLASSRVPQVQKNSQEVSCARLSSPFCSRLHSCS